MADNATDSGKIVMMEVDYSNNCDTKIPECKKLAQEGKLHDALDQLLALEKLARTVEFFLLFNPPLTVILSEHGVWFRKIQPGILVSRVLTLLSQNC